MRVLVILLDLVSISETQEPAVINDIARDSKLRLFFVLIGYGSELDWTNDRQMSVAQFSFQNFILSTWLHCILDDWYQCEDLEFGKYY